MLDITKVQIHLMRGEGVLRGFADIIISDCFIVRQITIVQGPEYMYISMPNHILKGEKRDTAHPITEECRRQIEDAVLDAYEARLNEEYHGEEAVQVPWGGGN
jgi:stage V sporulation protein G